MVFLTDNNVQFAERIRSEGMDKRNTHASCRTRHDGGGEDAERRHVFVELLFKM